MDNKKRNEKILKIVCELLSNLNQSLEDAFVEDINDESEEKQVLVGLRVVNPAMLIGYRGKNLAALQLILSLGVKNKLGEWIRVIVDVNDYRQEQKVRLEKMVMGTYEKVKSTGTAVSLGIMSSFERRICHLALQGKEDVFTESEGEGEERHVVVKPKQE